MQADASGRELNTLIDLLSTNVTSFFRESHHFDHLRDDFLAPRLADGDPSVMRVWSAACSSGEEPYSIAMTFANTLGVERLRRFLVLATDISHRMVAHARQATYEKHQLDTVPLKMRSDWTTPQSDGRYSISHSLKDRVQANRLNLLERWPITKEFDVIFCRNALIYFDQALQQQLVRRFHNQLRPGGYFYIGHSESLTGLDHQFEFVKPTIYRKAS